MKHQVSTQPKKLLDSHVLVETPWMTLHEQRVLSNGGDILSYPVVTRSDSVIVIVRQKDHFLLSDAQYRPGIGERTLDFPGGRIDERVPVEVAELAVRRELGIADDVKLVFTPITDQPLIVDSAFSNQKLYGFQCIVPDELAVDAAKYRRKQLLGTLHCLQCRALLLELLVRSS